VERIVLNALPNNAAMAAGYVRLRRLVDHRLEDKSIHPLSLRPLGLPSARGGEPIHLWKISENFSRGFAPSNV
jgi:hypothetical protein